MKIRNNNERLLQMLNRTGINSDKINLIFKVVFKKVKFILSERWKDEFN